MFLHVNVSVFVHNSRTKDDENIQGVDELIHGKSKISPKVYVFHLEISSANNFRRLATLIINQNPDYSLKMRSFLYTKFIKVYSEIPYSM